MVDPDELKDLPLAERIRKLREMQEQAQKDIDEARKLESEFEEELIKQKRLEGIEVPKAEPIDISKLFFTGEGLEAAASVEQVADEDFVVEYGRIFQDMDSNIMSHYVTFQPVLDRIEEVINAPAYDLPQDKLSDATASTSTADKVRKYTKG